MFCCLVINGCAQVCVYICVHVRARVCVTGFQGLPVAKVRKRSPDCNNNNIIHASASPIFSKFLHYLFTHSDEITQSSYSSLVAFWIVNARRLLSTTVLTYIVKNCWLSVDTLELFVEYHNRTTFLPKKTPA